MTKWIDTLAFNSDGGTIGVCVTPQLCTLAATLRLLCCLKSAIQGLGLALEALDCQECGKVLQQQQ